MSFFIEATQPQQKSHCIPLVQIGTVFFFLTSQCCSLYKKTPKERHSGFYIRILVLPQTDRCRLGAPMNDQEAFNTFDA